MPKPSKRPRAHRHKALALLNATTLALLLTGSAFASSLQQVHAFDIEAQPLADALIHFGQQAGIQISVDSQLLRGKAAQPLHGEYSGSEALQHLLSGSGLYWKESEPGLLTLEQADGEPVALENIQVSSGLSQQGETVIVRDTFRKLPSGNGDLTSVLKLHPNVQFGNDQLSSRTPGEITPANVSINGAKFYQNAFLIDGLNMNNDIDPAIQAHNLADSVPGRSQGLALDTDLLDNIKVLDSNVSAAYGGFNGGVIEAATRRPSKDFHGRFSAQMTRSSWTRFHVDDDEEAQFESSSSSTSSYQPDFKKLVLRSTLEGHLTDDFGLLASFSQKTSTIPVDMFSYNNQGRTGYQATQQDQKRKIENLFLKGVWTVNDRLDLEASLTLAPEEASYYRDNALDTGYTVESGGTQFNLKANHQTDIARFEHALGLSRLENSRDSDADDWWNWVKSSERDWGVTSAMEGGYGDIEQRQDSLQYKLDIHWNSFNALGARHTLQSGLDYQRQQINYERLSNSRTYVLSTLGSGNCTSAQSLGGSTYCYGQSGLNQYVRQISEYRPGEIDFSLDRWALYLQDDMSIARLSVRPGLRLDGDDYMDKTTLAPRLAVEYDLFGDASTRLIAGANRYYGRSAAAWKLRDGRNTLQSRYTRTNQNAAWTTTPQLNTTRFNTLDIPYDDEWTLGVTQQWQSLEFALKYVNRRGRDQIINEPGPTSSDPSLSSSYEIYTNNGWSDTETWTLTVTPLHSLDWQGTRNSVQLALDWRDHETNHTTYDDDYEDRYVYFEGKRIHISQLPPDDYNRDWTVRLTSITEIPDWNISLSNFWRYRAGFERVERTYPFQTVNGDRVYSTEKYSPTLSWDMRIGWELPTAREQAMFVNLDVFNLLDSKTVSDRSNITDAMVYETGRQFWLEVGYRF